MKKYFLFILLSSPALALDNTPVDRYGGHYGAPATEYGVTYHFHQQPAINDFEYRAMFDDLATVYKSTGALSECSRYKFVQIMLEIRIDPYITYPPGVFRSTTPFDVNSLANVCEEGKTLPFK